MFPGGQMPVTQLIAMLHSTPSKEAVRLLMAIPRDRLALALAQMRAADVVRLLSVAKEEYEYRIVEGLSVEGLVELVDIMSDDQSSRVLSMLPENRLREILNKLPRRILLGLPADRRVLLPPEQARELVVEVYQQDVVEALARVNAEIVARPEPPLSITLVRVLGWSIAVAARFSDNGQKGVSDAEAAALRMRANAALSVTPSEPAPNVLRYCEDARREGRPLSATIWTDRGDDAVLARSLVGLLRS